MAERLGRTGSLGVAEAQNREGSTPKLTGPCPVSALSAPHEAQRRRVIRAARCKRARVIRLIRESPSLLGAPSGITQHRVHPHRPLAQS